MAEDAISSAEIAEGGGRPTRRVSEAQHAMVALVGDPEGAVAAHRHPLGLVHRACGRTGIGAGERGLAEDTVGVRTGGQARRAGEAQHSIVGGIGDPEDAVAAHCHPLGPVQRVCGRVAAAIYTDGVKSGLAEDAVGKAEIAVDVGCSSHRVGEAQHSIVGGIGDPEGAAATHRHPTGSIQRVRGRVAGAIGTAAGEIGLAEDAVGGRAIGQARHAGEAQHPIVGIVGDEDPARRRIHRYRTGIAHTGVRGCHSA